MRARWTAARSWSPTFAQEAVIAIAGTVAAAFVVGVSLGAGLTRLVTRH